MIAPFTLHALVPTMVFERGRRGWPTRCFSTPLCGGSVENIIIAKDVGNIMLDKPLLSLPMGPVRTLRDKPPRLDTQL